MVGWHGLECTHCSCQTTSPLHELPDNVSRWDERTSILQSRSYRRADGTRIPPFAVDNLIDGGYCHHPSGRLLRKCFSLWEGEGLLSFWKSSKVGRAVLCTPYNMCLQDTWSLKGASKKSRWQGLSHVIWSKNSITPFCNLTWPMIILNQCSPEFLM